MFRTRRPICRYRTLTGHPQRGICEISSASQAWLKLVRQRAEALRTSSERAFSNAAATLRERLRTPQETLLVDHVVESFALTTEALRRSTGLIFHDVQLQAGFAIAAGVVAEIQTGEGKTLVTALPAALHACVGNGVHVATTNHYLSSRDCERMRPVYQSLGLTAATLSPHQTTDEKRQAYAAEITYGPGFEFGFDFLRDQVARQAEQRRPLGDAFLRRLDGSDPEHATTVQRGLSFVIVDEADSVMLDEANTPLIISGAAERHQTSLEAYTAARNAADALQAGVDYTHDASTHTIALTLRGLESILPLAESLPHRTLARRWEQLVTNALRAEHTLRRNVDYIIDEARIQIVDPHTGRIHPERRWSDGLHQAVETKENVPLSQESTTQARITRQRFLSLYSRLAGMTGTASGSENELRATFGVPVVRVPTHRPSQRKLLPMRLFASQESLDAAVIDDALRRHRRGQPVLIGTASIEHSKRLADALNRRAVPHVVLNGLQDQREANVIAHAGHSGAITVATNMAGRGTDIQPDPQALAAGGLHVIATGVHSNRRVDRQLAGRAARQGDPGSCQFLVSADDGFLTTAAPDLTDRIRSLADQDGECHADLSAEIDAVQRRAEQAAWQRRRQLVAHDDWFESVQSSLARRA